MGAAAVCGSPRPAVLPATRGIRVRFGFDAKEVREPLRVQGERLPRRGLGQALQRGVRHGAKVRAAQFEKRFRNLIQPDSHAVERRRRVLAEREAPVETDAAEGDLGRGREQAAGDGGLPKRLRRLSDDLPPQPPPARAQLPQGVPAGCGEEGDVQRHPVLRPRPHPRPDAALPDLEVGHRAARDDFASPCEELRAGVTAFEVVVPGRAPEVRVGQPVFASRNRLEGANALPGTLCDAAEELVAGRLRRRRGSGRPGPVRAAHAALAAPAPTAAHATSLSTARPRSSRTRSTS